MTPAPIRILRRQSRLLIAPLVFATAIAVAVPSRAQQSPWWAEWSGLSIAPASINFGSLTVASSSTPVLITLENVSNAAIAITGISTSLPEVTVSGPALPVTLNPGQALQVSVVFSPDAATTFSGSLIFNESSGRFVRARLSGIGLTAPVSGQLSLSSSTAAFGSVTVGTTVSQNLTVSNPGSATLTIGSVTLAGAGFNVTGISTGTILAPGQSAELTVTFDPSSTGSVSGSITIANGTGAAVLALSGTGVTAQGSHSAQLNWNVDAGATDGYNVYRGTISGGPYTKITTTPVAMTAYTDSSVQASQIYYFVVTAVASDGTESAYSNEVSAAIP